VTGRELKLIIAPNAVAFGSTGGNLTKLLSGRPQRCPRHSRNPEQTTLPGMKNIMTGITKMDMAKVILTKKEAYCLICLIENKNIFYQYDFGNQLKDPPKNFQRGLA
jgi:hypothetical protein